MEPNSNHDSTILMVEDSLTQAEHLRQVLHEGFPGCEIRYAKHGLDALEDVDKCRPSLIISDIVMPTMDGYDMCRALKQNPNHKDIPVVLLTSLTDPTDIIKGLNSGTDYYLTKPFESEFIVSKINSILDNLSGPESDGQSGWRIQFGGQSHTVHADLQQMLNLLLSTYENAVQQNKQLQAAQDALRTTNERLEERVRERTRELTISNDQLRVEIGEHTQTQEQLRVQLQRLDALRQIDLAISGSLDLTVALNVLLNQVCSQLNVDAADVLLLRPHSLELEFAASLGFMCRTRITGLNSYSNELAHRAATSRRIVRVDDLRCSDSLPRTHEEIEAEGFVSYIAVPLIAKGRTEGVLELFHREAIEDSPEWLDFLESLASQAAIAIDSALMFENVQRSNAELLDAYDTTLRGWSRALDLRDKETEGHSMRVTQMTERIAKHVGVTDEDLLHMRRGALLHDIGKLAVPDSILRKPGSLSPEEREVMERHPAHAYEMLAPIGFLKLALDIPYCHHEKWDGSGYPRNLSGVQIPLDARIFAVADVWDALRSDRPYRSGWSRERVLTHILESSGSHFDPRIVDAFSSLAETLGSDIDDLPDNTSETELNGTNGV